MSQAKTLVFVNKHSHFSSLYEFHTTTKNYSSKSRFFEPCNDI